MDFYRYFTELTADRQAHPTDDLATLIANGTIDDAPMPELEKMGYYVIIATAGHDTTAAAMAGGLRATGSSGPTSSGCSRAIPTSCPTPSTR